MGGRRWSGGGRRLLLLWTEYTAYSIVFRDLGIAMEFEQLHEVGYLDESSVACFDSTGIA